MARRTHQRKGEKWIMKEKLYRNRNSLQMRSKGFHWVEEGGEQTNGRSLHRVVSRFPIFRFSDCIIGFSQQQLLLKIHSRISFDMDIGDNEICLQQEYNQPISR